MQNSSYFVSKVSMLDLSFVLSSSLTQCNFRYVDALMANLAALETATNGIAPALRTMEAKCPATSGARLRDSRALLDRNHLRIGTRVLEKGDYDSAKRLSP